MSLSKDLKKYPREFISLADVFEVKRVFRVKTRTTREGNALRFKLYGFKRAITEAGMQDAYPNFLASEVIVFVDTVLIQMPEDAGIMASVREALNEEAPPDGGLTPTLSGTNPKMMVLDEAEEGKGSSLIEPGPPARSEVPQRPGTASDDTDHSENSIEDFLKSSDVPK